eukprot:scaffold475472_cov21-Prasinocladus_malaysianus.AAC.1
MTPSFHQTYLQVTAGDGAGDLKAQQLGQEASQSRAAPAGRQRTESAAVPGRPALHGRRDDQDHRRQSLGELHAEPQGRSVALSTALVYVLFLG